MARIAQSIVAALRELFPGKTTIKPHEVYEVHAQAILDWYATRHERRRVDEYSEGPGAILTLTGQRLRPNCRNCGAAGEPVRCSYCLSPTP